MLFHDSFRIAIPVPPLSEQKAIADYLDTKTAQIDRKIDLLSQKAKLYSNFKQSLINETVTRGLDKSVLMNDSEYECDLQIPKHGQEARVKNIFKLI
jgi:type I restriction enzyme S subunit